jgi:hypothetical protein
MAITHGHHYNHTSYLLILTLSALRGTLNSQVSYEGHRKSLEEMGSLTASSVHSVTRTL